MNDSALDLEDARILIVDDVPANIDPLHQSLEAAGYQVLVATSGEDALGLLQELVPDLILLDVMMPGIDGFETCRRLKADERTAGVPVVFLTALDDAADIVEGFAQGRELDFVVVVDERPAFAVECKSGEQRLSRNVSYFAQRTDIPCFYQVHTGSKDYEVAQHRARVLPLTTLARLLAL